MKILASLVLVIGSMAYAQQPEDSIRRLEEKVAAQQAQIDELTSALRKVLASPGTLAAVQIVPAAYPVPSSALPEPAITPTAMTALSDGANPLSWRLGTAYMTPVGFADLTSVTRSTNPGSGIGTNFGSIPFSNAPNGKLSESRLTGQNSRIGLRVDAKFGNTKVLGYLESDFLGFLPTNAAVSSNSDSLRMRLYWVDVRRNKFELLAGQSWSMMTPNRKGISALPSDLFFTQNLDTNYQVGLVWERTPQVRAIYHPNDAWAMGISLENPEQYIGGSAGGGVITLPSGLSSAYTNQLDNGGTTLSVPNLHPDVVAKVSWDGYGPRKRNIHAEVGGVIRTFKVYDPATVTTYSASGGGGQANLNVEFLKNTRFVTNNYYSSGGGRYIFGQAPDVIVRGNGSLSTVHSASTVSGFEVQVKQALLYGYYGGIYVGRNIAIDPANSARVGYGYAGSPSGQNRTIQEITLGVTNTLWKDPKYGALTLPLQYSYVFRNPWSVAAGQPAQASTKMLYASLRYTLPGSPPIIK